MKLTFYDIDKIDKSDAAWLAPVSVLTSYFMVSGAQRVKQPSKQIRETFGDLIRPLVRSYIMESLARKKTRTVGENGINS